MPFLRSSLFNETFYNVVTFNEFVEVYHTYKNESGVHVNIISIENTLPRKIVWGTLLIFLFLCLHFHGKHSRLLKNRKLENTILPLHISKREMLDADIIRKFDIEYNESPLHKRKNIRSPKLSSGILNHSFSQTSFVSENSLNSTLETSKESF
jgi:hypothetical protein